MVHDVDRRPGVDLLGRAAMADYDEHSVLRTGDSEARGAFEIRAHLEPLMSGAPTEFSFERGVEAASDGRVMRRWRLVGGSRGDEVLSSGVDYFSIAGDIITASS
jgi:hypothetical protein